LSGTLAFWRILEFYMKRIGQNFPLALLLSDFGKLFFTCREPARENGIQIFHTRMHRLRDLPQRTMAVEE
jgi:hypothetical protein